MVQERTIANHAHPGNHDLVIIGAGSAGFAAAISSLLVVTCFTFTGSASVTISSEVRMSLTNGNVKDCAVSAS